MLIIDTDKNLHNFLSFYDKNLNLLLANKNELLFDLCERIIEHSPEEILINVEGNFENSPRTSLKSLDLLYWLRCKYNFKKPILLCGFLSIDKIRALKPKHTLLDSEGVTFFRLPFNLEKAKAKVDTTEISDSSLLEHAKSMFFLKQARHENANWWAMKTLLDCHSLKGNVVYPNIVIEKQKLLNNALASYIFRPNNSYEEDLKKSLKESNVESSNFEDSKQLEKQKIKQQILIYKNLIPRSTTIEKQNYRLQIAALESKLKTIDKKSNVLMIDDKALEGWKNVQEQVIGVSKNIDVIPFDFLQQKPISELVDSLWSKVDEYLEENSSLLEFIFLDLMLFPNATKHNITEEYSGLKILKLIKDKYDYIPILITSASNKIWNYQLALSYGADAYWIKEGIENGYELKDSTINYNKLLYLTKSFTSIEYSTLRKFKEINNRNFQKRAFWWINKKWSDNNIEVTERGITYSVPKQQLVDRQDVLGYLLSFSKLLNLYIYETVVLKKTLSNKDKQSHFASLCVLIGKVIELIHPRIRGKNNKHLSTGAISKSRGDEEGSKLYDLRNKYSHNSLRRVRVDSNLFFTNLNQFYSYLFKQNIAVSLSLKKNWDEKFKKDEKILRQEVIKKEKSKESKQNDSLPQREQEVNNSKTILDQSSIEKISSLLNEEKAIERIEIHYKN